MKTDVKRNSALYKLLSLILCVCMILPAVGFLLPEVGAASSDEGTGRVTQRAAHTADNNTMYGYENTMLSEVNGSRYAGRVWADLTVIAYDANKGSASVALQSDKDGVGDTISTQNDFLHVFSALGSGEDKTVQSTSNSSGFAMTPVAGKNDAGVDSAVTFINPIGDYMEVKNVQTVLLFGKLHDMVRYAVYDFGFNDAYMVSKGQQGTDFAEGWYKGTADAIDAVKYSENLPGDYSTEEDAWADGWVYRVGRHHAAEFVPTLESLNENSQLIDMTDQQMNTVYTFYRFTEDGRTTPQENPTLDGVSYKLSDIRVWVENTGDWNDQVVEGGALENGTGYDEALYVNVPAEAMPYQMASVVVSKDADGKETVMSYDANLDVAPLRVFYSVGVQDAVRTDDGELDVGKIDASYLQNHKNAETGKVSFYSTWYSGKAYDGYVTEERARTMGDAVVTFSPSVENRYYIFQKPLLLYSRAYQYDGSGLTRITGDDIKSDSWSGGEYKGTYSSKEEADKHLDGLKSGDIIFVKNDTLANAVSRNSWYFMAVDYYVPSGNSGKQVKYVVARQGEEFLASNLGNVHRDDNLCWVNLEMDYETVERDENGNLLPSDARKDEYSEGEPDHKQDQEGDQKDNQEPEVPETPENPDNPVEPEEGRWALATQPGGIRVGDLAQSIGTKGFEIGGGYISGQTENKTGTAFNYYLPTVSQSSTANGDITINVYLGNNGVLTVDDSLLLVTKSVEEGVTDPDAEFDYQVYLDDFSGTASAIQVRWDEYAQSWRRRLAYIDVLTNNDGLLQYSNYDDTTGTGLAVTNVFGKIVDLAELPDGQRYYVYVGQNDDSEAGDYGSDHVFRVFSSMDYDDTLLKLSGRTTYVDATVTPMPEDDGSHHYIDINSDEGQEHKAGDIEYWAKEVYTIPASEYDEAVANGGWTFDAEKYAGNRVTNYMLDSLSVVEDGGLGSEIVLTSPFAVRSTYLTKELEFGVDALYDTDDVRFMENGEWKTAVQNEGDAILSHTAHFTLKGGEGLLFNNITADNIYRVTEKMSDEQIADLYYLSSVGHVQQMGQLVTYNEDGTVQEAYASAGSGDLHYFWKDGEQVDASTELELANTFKNHAYSIAGTISADAEEAVHYLNARIPTGALKVTKTVTGDLGDQNMAFPFTVTLDDPSVNGTYGDMEFLDGVAEFTLKHGESKTAIGLPDGTVYDVEESDNAGYEVTAAGDTGTIDDAVMATADFVNHKDSADVTSGPDQDPGTGDDPTSGPSTGDSRNFTLWIIICAVAAAVMIGAIIGVVIMKTKKYNSKH